MTDRELMQQALDAFVWNYNTDLDNIPECEQWLKLLKTNIAGLRNRLEQPEQEPVAWANSNDLQNFDMRVRTNGGPLHTVPLYTTPPQRKPLTDEQKDAIVRQASENDWHDYELIMAVEAAHGIKS